MQLFKMSIASGSAPQEMDTPDAGGRGASHPTTQDEEGEEEVVFKYASDAGKVFMRRAVHRPPVQRLDYFPPPVHCGVSTPSAIKPESFDGTSD